MKRLYVPLVAISGFLMARTLDENYRGQGVLRFYLNRVLRIGPPFVAVLALTWVHSSSGLKMPIRKVADALAEINASVNDLARIGQTNAAASEEITSTMVELARLAKQTRDEIDRFRTS